MIPPCLTSWPHAAAISRATGPVVAAEYTPPLPPKPPMMAWPFCSTVTPGIKPAKRCRKVNSHHMLLGFTNNSIYCSLPLKYITILMVLYDSINYYYKYISIPLTLWFFGRCSARRLEAQSQWRRPRRPWQNSGHGVWKYGLSISIIYDLWFHIYMDLTIPHEPIKSHGVSLSQSQKLHIPSASKKHLQVI